MLLGAGGAVANGFTREAFGAADDFEFDVGPLQVSMEVIIAQSPLFFRKQAPKIQHRVKPPNK